MAGVCCCVFATLIERRTRRAGEGGQQGFQWQCKTDPVEVRPTLPLDLYKSLAWDRDSEMAEHKRIALASDIQMYFCEPRHPWQRSSNENTNRLLRQCFPKSTDSSKYSQTTLSAVARQLNSRPRKTLDYETPAECFHYFVASIG